MPTSAPWTIDCEKLWISWPDTSLSMKALSRRAASWPYSGSSAMSAAAVRIDSWSSSCVVAPSYRPPMVFRATRIGSTACRPSAVRVTALHDLVDVNGFLAAVALGDPHLPGIVRRGQCEITGIPGGRSKAGRAGRREGNRRVAGSVVEVFHGHLREEAGLPTHGDVDVPTPCSNACSRAQGPEGLAFTEKHADTQALEGLHATRLPAEAATRARQLQHRTVTSQQTRRRRLARRVGRSSDSWTTDLSIHLLSHGFPGAAAQCHLLRDFVSTYRCGAVPDSHRIPF